MENRIFPSWSEIEKFHNPLTEGEKALVHFLDESLPKEWMIFVQPYLNGSRPDVIIFNPLVSMMIYEVKDWDLSLYHWTLRERASQGSSLDLCFSNGGNPHSIKNPIKQVEHYREKIISQLVSPIGEEVDRNSSAFGLVKIGVYFHNATGRAARSFFGKEPQKIDKRYKLHNAVRIVGFDDLRVDNLRNVVSDVGVKRGKFMKEEWAKEILFWLKPPFHSLEQTQPLKLTPQQQEHAEPRPGHFRLRGAAGSGKTQVIAYRAAKLASQGLNVLVVTFNITLWHYIKDMIARAPFEFEWSKITFNHFHGFCKDVLNYFEEDWPEGNGDDLFAYVVPQKVLATIEGKDYQKWDAILIDEGQDYYWEWYNCLCRFLEDRDELLLVCDSKQNIYARELNWIDGMRNVKFRGRWRELNTIFRLPKRVSDEANRFSEMFKLGQFVEGQSAIQLNLFERPLNPHLVWVNIQDRKWLSYVADAYERLKSENCHPSDIVILLPNRFIGMTCVKHFERQKVEVNHVFEDDEESKFHRHKKSFWLGDSRLKMSTIHSFKGWEALNIILFIPQKWRGRIQNLDAVVYTAITRTRENLIVLNSNRRYIEYGRDWPNKWK